MHRPRMHPAPNTGRASVLPSQVAVYVPESGHPAYGAVRAYVKDANDQGNLAFLDSDGQLNNNANRTKAGAPPRC